MKWLEKTLDKLERMIRPFAIANIAMLIVAGQVVVYFAALDYGSRSTPTLEYSLAKGKFELLSH